MSSRYSPFICVDDAVDHRVNLGVDSLTCHIRIIPGYRLSDALREGDGTAEVRHDAPNLGIIEDHAARLVAEEPGAGGRVEGIDQLGWYVHQSWVSNAGCLGDCHIDLIPRQHLIAGDVEALANGLDATEQTH